MLQLISNWPLLLAMLPLMALSAFFSASEAALFSLRHQDRKQLRTGSSAARQAVRLLEDPDRLLSAILFWNLLVNIVYFALASKIGLRLRDASISSSLVATFTVGSVLAIIFFSEMLPKTIAVLKARQLSSLLSVPLTVAVRAVDPLMPTLRAINLLSRRLLWPTFQPEQYLEVSDLARAIELSTDDGLLADGERAVLRRIVRLSDTRVDECMRPRSQVVTFQAPVRWSDVQDRIPPSGYLLITEGETAEIVSALDLDRLYDLPDEHLERYAEQVVYVPWCTTAADALQALEAEGRDTAAVVNELGETIGVLTRRDVLDLVFSSRRTRSERLLHQQPLRQVREGVWKASGMTNVRVVAERLGCALPESDSVTLVGVLQESLQRLPAVGDRCLWGPLELEVVSTPVGHPVVLHVRLRAEREPQS